MPRIDGRLPAQLREITIEPDFPRKNAVLVSYGATRVLCYASLDERVPGWLVGSGSGWVTGEYSMLPSAGQPRQQRERLYSGGRTQEIQRLVGRALRAAVNLSALPPVTITVDCDVLLADGGTRTASITGAMIALCHLLHQEAHRVRGNKQVLKGLVAAVSAGIVQGQPVLDLNYVEDRDAEVDCNLVGLSTGGLAEVQATNEHGSFSREQLDGMLDLALPALERIFDIQRAYIPQKDI